MTTEEIKSIAYECTGVKKKENEFITVFTSTCGRFQIRHHVPTPKFKRFQSSFFDYTINGKVYKTRGRYHAALLKISKQ